jgi:hypothetical protein
MVARRRIFVGSSSEAQGVAKLVCKVIKSAGMESVLWEKIFPAGDILLDKIEQLPNSVDGVVLLATPDLACNRKARKEKKFCAPVQNVVFEHGYLSGRLSRKRVAICKFEGAEIPSDLEGLTIVRAGRYEKSERLALSTKAERSLRRWLTSLVPLAAGIPSMRRVHGYSGAWDVQNRFSTWHGIKVGRNKRNNLVSWDGKAFLHIRDDGQEGYGTQIGQLKVKLGQYRAIWHVANEVIRAAVDKDGALTMRIEVRARSLVDETGTPPSERVHETLPAVGWNLALTPVPGGRRKLEGTHVYPVGGSTYSKAKEYYTYGDV